MGKFSVIIYYFIMYKSKPSEKAGRKVQESKVRNPYHDRPTAMRRAVLLRGGLFLLSS